MLRLSPDGRFLAYDLDDGEQADIWIHDIDRNVPTRLTFDPAPDYGPLWSPSGKSIVFASRRDGVENIYWRRADSSGDAQRLIESSSDQFPVSWHPDGRYLAIYESTDEGQADLRVVELEGDDQLGWTGGEVTDFAATRFSEITASFSPDGRWLAYGSNESGSFDVLVQRFPGGGSKKRISTGGGTSLYPIWSRASQELIFSRANEGIQEILVAGYSVEGETFNPKPPIQWQGAILPRQGFLSGVLNLHPDGDRFLVRSRVDSDSEIFLDRLVFFENFFRYLRESMPPDIE